MTVSRLLIACAALTALAASPLATAKPHHAKTAHTHGAKVAKPKA